MKIPLFICLNLAVSSSFAMPIVQSPILFAQDFVAQKSDNTTAKTREAKIVEQPMLTSSESSVTTTTPSESAVIESKNSEQKIASSQYDQLTPITTSVNVQQVHTKTVH